MVVSVALLPSSFVNAGCGTQTAPPTGGLFQSTHPLYNKGSNVLVPCLQRDTDSTLEAVHGGQCVCVHMTCVGMPQASGHWAGGDQGLLGPRTVFR